MSPTLIIAIGGALVVIALVLMGIGRRGGTSGDMIQRQKREAQAFLDNAPPPRMDPDAPVAPDNLPSDEASVLGQPDICSAIDRGRKIEAIKLVRERTGLGLKEAKRLVDLGSRHRRRR